MTGLESAGFPGQKDEEIARLLHIVKNSTQRYDLCLMTNVLKVVVGGGPTGVEVRIVGDCSRCRLAHFLKVARSMNSPSPISSPLCGCSILRSNPPGRPQILVPGTGWEGPYHPR